ncbi:MAG TPA: hypothetical protein VNA16_07755, partial [Abditibacteriaceae bacterium]|nr:hypothetical protein [Abditibacteriaceae bacterium]
KVMEAYNRLFRPEFRNRLDEVIVFHHLSSEQILEIVDLMAARVQQEIARREMSLVFMQAAKELLAKEGYDRAFGARPLRRAVQRLIEDPLAERLLMGDFKAGDTVYVDAQNGEMVFTTELPSGELAAEPISDGDDGAEPKAAKIPVSPEDQERLSAMMGE